VAIDFAIDGDKLSLRVCDNGAGFDPQLESAGHGLVSMRRRVESLGGNLKVESNEGSGTSVSLVIPLIK